MNMCAMKMGKYVPEITTRELVLSKDSNKILFDDASVPVKINRHKSKVIGL